MTVVRQNFDHDLESLRQDLVHMGEIVQVSIKDAVDALAKRDKDLARRVMEGDDVIDRMQVEIEDRCISLIARQQPVATDLRILGTGLKITTDLERIGDHAFDIAKIVLLIGDEPLIKPLVDIPRMAEISQQMLKDSLQAYLKLDIELAEQVCRADDMVDKLYHQVFRELLTYMLEDAKKIKQATQLIFVARYLERIADHSTNVAEWVIYLATGERLRKK
ncbi:MAG: phosphate signaling complex protein PhoU [Negativicutes bacterium]|nr:phosphate signaling complex protein PhoU [Negativicutes bacterium]